LGFKHKYNLEEGLAKTYLHYLNSEPKT